MFVIDEWLVLSGYKQLADAYGESDRWAQQTLAEHDPAPGWPARMTTAQEAAFHLYSRGAIDYRP